MKLTEATSHLKGLGWKTSKDEVGDSGALYFLPDRTVQMLYGIRSFKDGKQFEASVSVSTENFSHAFYLIRGIKGKFIGMIRFNQSPRIKSPQLENDHILEATDAALAWARQQDLHAALLKHAAIPFEPRGTGPVLHLSALALLGDVDQLFCYRRKMAAGDRLTFVPYVTLDFIDRAISFAEEFKNKA